MRIRIGRRGSRLSSAYGDEIVSCTDEPVSSLVDVAEIPRTERQLHMLLLAGFQMNALEPAQRLQRCARYLREADVDLSHFVAVPLTRVLDVHVDIQRTASLQLWVRQFHPAIFEGGVTQAVAEAIERLAREVPVGTVLHVVIFEVGQLFGAFVE